MVTCSRPVDNEVISECCTYDWGVLRTLEAQRGRRVWEKAAALWHVGKTRYICSVMQVFGWALMTAVKRPFILSNWSWTSGAQVVCACGITPAEKIWSCLSYYCLGQQLSSELRVCSSSIMLAVEFSFWILCKDFCNSTGRGYSRFCESKFDFCKWMFLSETGSYRIEAGSYRTEAGN